MRIKGRKFWGATRWVDNMSEKHKHIYSIPTVAELMTGTGSVLHFSVLKCELCNSFVSNPCKGSPQGLLEDFDEALCNLPKLYLITSHKYNIDFRDCELVKKRG